MKMSNMSVRQIEILNVRLQEVVEGVLPDDCVFVAVVMDVEKGLTNVLTNVDTSEAVARELLTTLLRRCADRFHQEGE